jgi:hypothetical protein
MGKYHVTSTAANSERTSVDRVRDSSFRHHPARTISPLIGKQWGLGAKRPGDPWEPRPYNDSHITWRFKAHLQADNLVRAAQEIVKRHAVLRCQLRHVEGGWRFLGEQVFHPQVYELDASTAGANAEPRAMELLSEIIWRPFNPETDGPFRVVSVRISADDYLIGFVLHHLFADGYSAYLCSKELVTLYDAYCRGQHAALEELPLQLFDYMISMEEWCNGPLAQEHVSHWRQYLEGAHGAGLTIGHDTTMHQFRLPRESSDALRELSKSEGVRANLFWEAAHHIALWHLTGQTDITTLTFDSGRRRKELLGLMGPFDNRLPVRSHISPDFSFRQFLGQMAGTKRSTAAFRTTPYDLIVDHCPFTTQTVGQFNFVPQEFYSPLSFGVLLDIPVPADVAVWTAPFPWGFGVFDEPEFSCGCGGNVLTPFTANEMGRTVERVTCAVIQNPDTPLRALQL